MSQRNRSFTELKDKVDLSMANCECHNQIVSINNGEFMGFSMGFSVNEIVISWDLMVI
jgi:acetyl-CoA carboxylase beta subunit